MALRSIDIILNEDSTEEIVGILKSQSITDYWVIPFENKILVKCLVSSESLEAFIDLVESTFSTQKGHRLIVSQVEATLPRIDEKKEQDTNGKSPKNAIMRVSREELHFDLVAEADLNVNYVVLIILSSIVAGIGILQDNIAIIIAAMVIAPLVGPNMALAFATTLGDLKLVKKSALTLLVGTLLAFVICVIWGYFDPTVQNIASQLNVRYGDLVLAFVAGVAGVLSILRGTSTALVGVMVAVALLPPWVKTALLLGSGQVEDALYSLLLFSINVISLNLAGILTFLVAGIRPYKWWEVELAKIQTRKALILWISLFISLALLVYFLEYH